jgi:hypothetical protein
MSTLAVDMAGGATNPLGGGSVPGLTSSVVLDDGISPLLDANEINISAVNSDLPAVPEWDLGAASGLRKNNNPAATDDSDLSIAAAPQAAGGEFDCSGTWIPFADPHIPMSIYLHAMELKIMTMDKLSQREKELVQSELDRLIAVANSTPSQILRRRNDCGLWMIDVLNKFGSSKAKVFKVEPAGWDYYLGIPGTDWWLGHNTVKVTLPDGTVFYLDDGWWGGIFIPEEIPWYVTPIPLN